MLVNAPKETKGELKSYLEKHPNVNSAYKINNSFTYMLDVVFPRLDNLDIAVIDPLCTGQLLFGDPFALEQGRCLATELPITERMVEYAVANAADEEVKASGSVLGFNRAVAAGYALTYCAVVESSFAQGVCLLTKRELLAP